MPTCSAYGCAYKHCRNKVVGKSVHKFPFGRPDLLKRWIVNVRRDDWIPSRRSVLCSDHFEPSCFDRTGITIRLKNDAVPTIFDFPSDFKKLPKDTRRCQAANCSHTDRNCDLTFFIIPRDPERRLKWLTNIELAPSTRKEQYLCSDHFDDRAFSSTLRKRLLPEAVPTYQTVDKISVIAKYPCLDVYEGIDQRTHMDVNNEGSAMETDLPVTDFLSVNLDEGSSHITEEMNRVEGIESNENSEEVKESINGKDGAKLSDADEKIGNDITCKMKIQDNVGNVISNDEVDEDAVCVRLKESALMHLDEIIESDGILPGYEESDECVEMTLKEVKDYISMEIDRLLKDEDIDPVNRLKKKAEELNNNMDDVLEQNRRIKKYLDNLYRDQEKFLRHMHILPPIQKKNVEIQVDMPYLPESPAPKVSTPAPPDQKASQSNGPIEVIDLTDEMDEPTGADKSATCLEVKHPAPLPGNLKIKYKPTLPPKVYLKAFIENNGLTLQWSLQHNSPGVVKYNIYGYQEPKNGPALSTLWQKIGSVSAMELPMACTLCNVEEGFSYHFRVQAVDSSGRVGFFSEPASIKFGDVS